MAILFRRGLKGGGVLLAIRGWWLLRYDEFGGIGMRVKKRYAFAVDFEEEDGGWSADIRAAPVCAAWGFTRAEALAALQDLARIYFEALLEYGDPFPDGIGAYEIVGGGGAVARPEMVVVEV